MNQENVGELVVHLGFNVATFQRALSNVQSTLQEYEKKFASLGAKLSVAVTAPLSVFAHKAVGAFSEFDNAMNKSLTVLGEVAPQLREEMEAVAHQISGNSVTAAKVLAESYYDLNSAFGSAYTSMATLGQVEKFAVAGGFDMAKAARYLIGSLRSLGIESNTTAEAQKNLAYIANLLQSASSVGTGEVEDYAAAMMKAGPIINAYKLNLEASIAAIMTFRDMTNSGEEAGHMFARAMNFLMAGVGENAKAFKKFGIETRDSKGNLLGLSGIVADMTKAFSKLTNIQAVSALKELGFAAEAAGAILPLLGKAEQMDRFTASLNNMGDAVDKVYLERMKSFGLQMQMLQNRVENLAEAIGKKLAPYILMISEGVKTAIDIWNGLGESLQNLAIGVGAFAASVGPLLVVGAGLIWAGGQFIGLIGLMVPVISGIFGGLFSLASIIAGAFSIAIGPIGLVIAAIGGIGYIIASQTTIVSDAVAWIGDQFSWLSEQGGALLSDIEYMMEGVKRALIGGDIVQAVRVLWSFIQLEFARGLNVVLEYIGPWYDYIVAIWDGIALTAMKAANYIYNAFWKGLGGIVEVVLGVSQMINALFWAALKGVVSAIAWAATKAIDLARHTGALGAQEAEDAYAKVDQIEAAAKGNLTSHQTDNWNKYEGWRKGMEDVVKQKAMYADAGYREYKEKSDNAMAGYKPIAERSKENLERAQGDQMVDLRKAWKVYREKEIADQAAKEKADAARKAAEEEKPEAAAKTPVTATSQSDVGYAAGSFFAGGVNAFEKDDKAQDTRTKQLSVQEEIRDSIKSLPSSPTQGGVIVVK